MHLGRIIGRVVSTVKQDTLVSLPLLWVQPLRADGASAGRPLVAIDRIGAGQGEVVVYVTSREAAVTLEDPFAAVDAGIIAKVDWCEAGDQSTLHE